LVEKADFFLLLLESLIFSPFDDCLNLLELFSSGKNKNFGRPSFFFSLYIIILEQVPIKFLKKFRYGLYRELTNLSNTNFTLKITNTENYGILFETDYNKYIKYSFNFPTQYNVNYNFYIDLIEFIASFKTPTGTSNSEKINDKVYRIYKRMAVILSNVYKKIIN